MNGIHAAMIWCPFGSRTDAESVARQLLADRLVACANILPAVTSIFAWNGEVQTADEVAVLFKTDGARLDRATARLAELHPYDTPAIAGWMSDSTPQVTGAWLEEVLGEGGEG